VGRKNEKKGEMIMNACALKPRLPFVARTELKRTPATEDNRKMVEFMDSHDFSVSIDMDSKELRSRVTPKKENYDS
jgi:hypothetical protein